MTNTLPSIEEVESSPDFQSLPLSEQQLTLQGYFDEKESLATTEEEYNETIKERADRELLALHMQYRSKFPQPTGDGSEEAPDSFKTNIESDPQLKGQYDKLQKMYGELDYNVNKSVTEAQSFSADDMEDKDRKLQIKPFLRNGKKGFNVVYPDGFQESILQDGIEDVNQLTDFFQKERLGRFRGKREGWYDQAVADQGEELNLIRDKIRNTASTTLGGYVGDIEKGVSNVSQRPDIINIDSITKALNRHKEAKAEIAELDRKIKRAEDFATTSGERMDIAELKRRRQQAQDIIDNRNNGSGGQGTSKMGRALSALNPLVPGVAMSPEEAEPQLKEAYKSLADEIIYSGTIKGSRIAADVEDDIQRQAREAVARGESSDGDLSFLSYFKKNPLSLPGYIMSVAAQALPDLAIGMGSSIAGGMVGGVKGAAAAGGAAGFATEYSASLLSDLQIRAAKEGKNLTQPGVAEAYLNDEAFMAGVREKATKRAGAISLTDAVTGGIAEKIARGTKGAFSKALSTAAVSASMEALGESNAKIYSGEEYDLRGVIEEGFGALGSSVGSAARSAVGYGIDVARGTVTPSQAVLDANKRKWQNELFPRNDFSDTPLSPADGPNGPSFPTRDLTTGNKLPGEDSGYNKGRDRNRMAAITLDPNLEQRAPEDYTLPEVEDFQPEKELTPEEIQTQLTERDTQLTATRTAQAAEDAAIKAGQDPDTIDAAQLPTEPTPQVDLSSADTDVSTPANREKNGPALIDRILRFLDRGRGTTLEDDEGKAQRELLRRGREILSNPLYRSVFDIISDQSGISFDRIMKDFRESNPDQDAPGRLMSAIGLDPNDANKHIITDIIGSYWLNEAKGNNFKDNKGNPLHVAEVKGLFISAALTDEINKMTGVSGIYDMPEAGEKTKKGKNDTSKGVTGLNQVNKQNTIKVQLGQDGGIESLGWPARSVVYSNMSPEEAVRRFKKSNRAQKTNKSEYDPSLDDKLKEAVLMNRPGAQVTSLGDPAFKNLSPKEIVSKLNKQYKGLYVIKPRDGDNGRGIQFSLSNTGAAIPANEMEKLVQNAIEKNKDQGGLDNLYVEKLQDFPTRYETDEKDGGKPRIVREGFNEYRVHVYVDNNGKAHAFRNLTYNKRKALYDQRRGARMAEEDTIFSVPASPNDPIVEAMQRHAEELMSKPEFAGNMFGLDMAMVDDGTGTGNNIPFAFEGNPTTTGMSGFVGNAISQSEMISELTGRPSVLSGMYMLAKLEMTKEQMNAISSAIKERLEHGYKDNPAADEAIQKGQDIYTPYIPRSTWLRAMQSAFNQTPIEFLKQLYAAIQNVYTASVDKYYENKFARRAEKNNKEYKRQEADMAAKAAYAESIKVAPQEPTKLRNYIERLRANPQLSENYRQILNFILKNSKDNLLDNVVVEQSQGGNMYTTGVGVVKIGKDAELRSAVHEVIHAVTSDFLTYNGEQLQLAFGFGPKEMSTQSEIQAMYDAVNPANRQILIDFGVSEDYLDTIPIYLAVLKEIGITRESIKTDGFHLGASGQAYKYQQMNNLRIPYGATNIHELLTEAMTKDEFREMLSKMPPITTNSRNLWQEIMRIIARILHIPIHKESLLFDAINATENVIKSPDNYYFVESVKGDGSSDSTSTSSKPKNPVPPKQFQQKRYQTFNSEQTEPARVSNIKDGKGRASKGKPVKASDTSQSTKDIAADPTLTPAQQETLADTAQKEKVALRFSKLKKQFASELMDVKFNPKDPMRSLKEARETLADHLAKEAGIDGADDASYNPDDKFNKDQADTKSATKKKWAAQLTENKLMAGHYAEELGVDPTISENHMKFITNALAYILNKTADVMNLTTNQIKYYNNILESFSDGGPPAGMKRVLSSAFIEEQQAVLAHMSGDIRFAKPIGKFRNEPAFGWFSGKLGSLASFASEIAYLAPAQNARKFLADLTGIMRDNINDQQLEYTTESTQFGEYVKRQFALNGGIHPIQRTRTGLVARLTQYNASHPSKTPVQQLVERYNQLIASLPVMKDMQPQQAQLTEQALKEIFGPAFATTDITTLGADEAAIISYIENRLAPPEKNVLIKVREIAQSYLPSLQTVKALTRHSALNIYHNFAHDVNVIHREPGEQHILQAFTAMSDILQDRDEPANMNPDEKPFYPEVDIIAIADAQLKAATYEKYTGVERYLLQQAIGPKSPLVNTFDRDTDSTHPVTNRLRKVVTSYHNSMVRAQPGTGPIIGIVEGLTNFFMGNAIWGVNQFVQNTVSSSVARATLLGLGREAFSNMFVYDTNSKELFNWIKSTNPTQFNRTSEYDTLNERENRWNVRNRAKASRDVHDNLWQTFLKVAPMMPKAVLDTYSKQVLRRLSNLSNAIPERRNAFAIYTAAYLHFAKQNGTVTDAADFFAKGKPFDKNAATQANDFVSRSLGYAPDKASKGDFWNGSTRTKQVLSKTFAAFRQQATGMSTNFQNEFNTACRLHAAGNHKEAAKAWAMAGALLTSALSFRVAAIAMRSIMIGGPVALGMYFNAKDDEDKKRKLLEAQAKYNRTSKRNNLRDLFTETAMMFAPVASAALAFEAGAAMAFDAGDLIVEPKNANNLLEGIQLKKKYQIKDELDHVNNEITKMNKLIREGDKNGTPTLDDEDKLDKLEQYKEYLSEQTKFGYFPKQGLKAFFMAMGGYGMAAEETVERIQTFIDQDLTSKEKLELRNMEDNEFAYHDPIVGLNYAIDMLHNVGQFIQKFHQPERRKEDRVPVSLWVQSILKMGMNPAVVVERGRKAVAKEHLKTYKENERKLERRSRYLLGTEPLKKETMTLEESKNLGEFLDTQE